MLLTCTVAAVATAAADLVTGARSTSSSLSTIWRRGELGKAGLAFASSNIPATSAQAASTPRSNFHAVYDDVRARDRFFLFLQNVYHLYPESQFHQLIIDTTNEFHSDEEIYLKLQERLPAIKPFLSEATYGLPALKKQKTEMARQTAELLGPSQPLSGYIEIGTTGRYANGIRSLIQMEGPLYIVNDIEPGYSPNDLVERGHLTKLGQFVPMGDYEPFDGHLIATESVDLVTVFIGMHHAPADKRTRFVQAIWQVLKPGGRLVVRDHDVDSPEMDAFVALAHDVFNAGLSLSWAENAAQIRNFTSITQLETVLGDAGFEKTGARLLQAHDPTQNTLMAYVKPASRAL